jgi:predicted Zn-dependent protease
MRSLNPKTLLAAAAITALLASAAHADLPCLVGCFSVNGRKGPFVTTLDAKRIEAARQSIKAAQGEGKGLSDHAANRGEFKGYGLDMPRTEAKLNELLAGVRKTMHDRWPELDPGPVAIHMIGSTSYGPQAMVDGSIVVPLGLIIRAKTDEEVVWVMSHELSHLALAHFARDAAQERRKQLIDDVAMALTMAMQASEIRAENTTSGYHLYAVNDPAALRRSNATFSMQDQARLLISLQAQAVSREQEDQADIAGADFALAANSEVEDASSSAFDQIRDEDERIAKATASLQQQMKGLATQSVRPQAVNALNQGDIGGAANDFLHTFMRNATTVAMQKGIAMLSNSHRSATQRKAGMRHYLDEAYKDLDSRNLTTHTIWLDEVRALSEYRDAAAAVNEHDAAEDLITQEKLDEAQVALQPALSGPYSDTPFIANLAARIANSQNNITKADELYDIAENPPVRHPSVAAVIARPAAGKAKKPNARGRVRSAPPVAPPPPPQAAIPAVIRDAYLQQSLSGYAEHVQLLSGHNLFPKARLKISEAEHRFGDHEVFLPDLIFMDFRSGQLDAMNAHLDECRHTQDDALWERCKYAILDESQKAQMEKLDPSSRAKLDRSLERKDEDRERQAGWKKMFYGMSAAQSGDPKP